MGSSLDWVSSLVKDILFNISRRRPPPLAPVSTSPKSYLITGALGGIGTELCERLTLEKSTKLLLQTRPSRLDQLKAFIEDRIHTTTETKFVGVDFTDLNSISDIASIVRNDDDKVDNVDMNIIHNAGLMSTHASVRDIHAVNCIAPFATSLLLLPELMRHNDEGASKVVFITSSSHIRSPLYKKGDITTYMKDNRTGAIALTAYAISKFNLLLSTKALKARLQGTSVVISSIHPGLVDTPMLQGAFGTSKFPFRHRLFLSPKEAANAILQCLAPTTTPTPTIPPSPTIPQDTWRQHVIPAIAASIGIA